MGVKKLRPTHRPLFVQPTVLRDDAPVEGESFPSGHAAIAFTAVGLLAPRLSTRVTAASCAPRRRNRVDTSLTRSTHPIGSTRWRERRWAWESLAD